MKSCKEKAAEWGISSRSVNDMCKKEKWLGLLRRMEHGEFLMMQQNLLIKGFQRESM